MYTNSKSGKVTVPHPEDDLDPKTLRSIAKQSGLAFEWVLERHHSLCGLNCNFLITFPGWN
ncbi:type II toxin-antitoxin system HicA family toxin [Alicyclobacillus acidiphilus]|uniref:type II toxin-antitoxin system HicA family toxin n=1 Tax=Alicyclobacillus acidiphilus TaxID=182455 RepID=UPI0009FA9E7F